MSRERTYIGIDLGGTSLKLAETDRAGNILRQRQCPSGRLDHQGALELISRELDVFLPGALGMPGAIGLGLVGRVDGKRGMWLEIDHDRPGELALRSILESKYGLPCFMDNDVRSAARAEWLFGKGDGMENWVYLNVGTGIAAATITGGRLITGGHCNAEEVGHSASGIDFHAPCACGRPDCVEPIASGLGFDTSARILAPDYPGTQLHIPQGSRVSPEEVFSLYGSDPLCQVLSDNAARALANLIMNLTRFCDPEAIILGGGVMTDGFLHKKMLERLNPYTMRYVTKGVALTGLAPQTVGLLGACANGICGMEEKR